MLPVVEGALRDSNGLKTVAATQHESAQRASKVMLGFFHHRDPAGVTKDEFHAKMFGRVGSWSGH